MFLLLFFCFVFQSLLNINILRFGSCLRFFEEVQPEILHEFVQSDQAVENYVALNNDDIKFYAPKCICFISYYPFLGAFRTCLNELYRISTSKQGLIPIERQLLNFMLEVPLPPKGIIAVEVTPLCFFFQF